MRHKALDTLLRFSSLVNSSLTIEDVLNSAMQSAEAFINAEASTVYELDEEKNELFVRMARGEKKAPVKRMIKLKPGEGIAGRVVKTGKPRVIQDVGKEKDFSDRFDRMTGFRTRSMMCVPLILRDKPIGVFQVLNKRSEGPFSRSDLELLTGMAQQLAVALDNARLYRRLENECELTAKELKITQEKLIRTDRLEAMAYLAQGVAHEIRNPVTTIGGFARRIKKAIKENPKVQEYIDIILEESERLENLVGRVREFAQILSPELKSGDIEPVLRQVIKKFEPRAKKMGIDLVAHMDDHFLPVKIDASQLFAALTSIIENAMEAMSPGGVLTVEAGRDMDSILIRILDTGPGIAKEDLGSVYDPFFTSKTRGAGLGLTIVHQIIRNHYGEITIRSGKGEGTAVSIRLPVAP
ncbi:MAG: GAF domain-containing protein [Deltaproteobacteria bacterium]|nr:GAF domain-containing protein [Deltaproteobacteria bacterium]